MDEQGRELQMIRDAEPRLYESLVAAGMAHLAGPENLVELLREAGVRVERVQ